MLKRKESEDEYSRSKYQMLKNNRKSHRTPIIIIILDHHDQCVSSVKRKISKSPIKKDFRFSHDAAHEQLLVLREENMHLKSRGKDLEEDVKL